MSRHDRRQARRILQLIQVLSKENTQTAKQLAQRLECSELNIRRDIELLKKENCSIHESDTRPTYYSLEHPWKTETAELDPVQALIKHGTLRLLHHHAPTPSQPYYQELLALLAKLPKHIQTVSSKGLGKPKTDSIDKDTRHLEKVATAWYDQQDIRFWYQKPTSDAPKQREATIVFMEISRINLDWYIFAREKNEQRIKCFLLSRMTFVESIGDNDSDPIEFDPKKELNGAWGVIGSASRCTITLRFSVDATPFVKDHDWPGKIHQKSHLETDGCYILVLSAPRMNDNTVSVEVMAWIRGWGPRVEIVSPKWLRKVWLDEAKQLLKRYDESSQEA